MQDHYLDDMLGRLKPLLKNFDRAKAILKRYWTSKMALVWDVKDVHRAANERMRVLTPKQAVQVLQTLHQQHNPQYGLKWVDLWDHLDLYQPGRKMSKAELKRFVAKDILAVQK